ncbi:P2Y purinoceptor 8-like [Aquarana catesbeiana]|uniref:P2Y purinoceptor 8-like n=1 Tax=Aquarana catesbeiana TaxID=8400 RepID=UPI003CC9E58C
MTEETPSAFTGNNTIDGAITSALSNHTLEMLQSKMLQNVLPAIYLFIFLVSTPLNVTSLWIFCRSQSKNPTMVFMINLTANDLVYSLTLPFLAVYHLEGNNWPFGDIFCSLTTIMFYANVNCSILTMMCISVERYVGIVHPLRFQNCMNIRKAFILCLVIWLLVLSIDIPLLYTKMTFYVHELNILTCFDILPKNMFSSYVAFYLYFACRFLAFFVIPIVTMVICYLLIITTLLRSHIKQSTVPKKQTIYTIVVLLLVLVICFVPNNVILITHSLPSTKQYTLYVAYKLSLALSGFNCCLDPFVYYFGSKEFRQNVKSKMYFLFHKNNTEQTIKTHTSEVITLS